MNRHAALPALLLAATLSQAPIVVAAAESTEALQGEFDSALQAIEEDRLRTARQKLQSLLAGNPSLQRARLELARVHYLTADYGKAREEAQRVLDDPNTPAGVRTTVLAFLAQIAEDEKRLGQRHQWTPSIYAGLMYDSNVNIGPRNDIVDLGEVAELSRPREDFAWVVTPALSHVYNPGVRFNAGEQDGSFIWQTDLTAYYRGYFDETDFNLGVVTLRTGPAWIVPRRWRAWIGLQGDQIWFGGDSLALFSSVNPGITWNLDQATELTLEGTLTDRKYHDGEDSLREGTLGQVNVALTRYFNDRRWALQVGAGYASFDADGDQYGYDAPQAHIGVIAEAWTNAIVFARVGYANYDFDGIQDITGVNRDDDELRYAAGFEHEYREGFMKDWSLIGNWIYTDNDSSEGNDVYDYDRHVVNLGLSRSF